MENQTTGHHGDVTIYQWNRTEEEGDAETKYYLPNWTDLVLAGLFTILIIVTIVSITIAFKDFYMQISLYLFLSLNILCSNFSLSLYSNFINL